jgi:hypothetical protein
VRGVHILGVGQLAGIGFTVALFVASLSFTGVLLAEAKIGILIASTASAIIGILLLLGARATGSQAPLASNDAAGGISRASKGKPAEHTRNRTNDK